jgi:drug/metabolite transporter (DMT)-like permease
VSTTLVLWASAFVAIRLALPGFGPPALSVGRLLVAALALGSVAPFAGVRRPAGTDLLRIAGCGVSGMAAYQLLLNGGERSVDAGTASLLVATSPIFAALLAVTVLHERLGRRGRLGIGIGFVGAATMAVAQGGSLRLSGDALLLLAAAVSQATFFVLQKPLLARYSGFEVTCYAMWSGALFSLPLTPWLIRDLGTAHPKALAALVFLGIAPSAIGFVTWAYGQARLPVATVANTLYVVPFIAIGVGWWLLGETVHPAAVAGGALALVGVAISRSGRPPRSSRCDADHGMHLDVAADVGGLGDNCRREGLRRGHGEPGLSRTRVASGAEGQPLEQR